MSQEHEHQEHTQEQSEHQERAQEQSEHQEHTQEQSEHQEHHTPPKQTIEDAHASIIDGGGDEGTPSKAEEFHELREKNRQLQHDNFGLKAEVERLLAERDTAVKNLNDANELRKRAESAEAKASKYEATIASLKEDLEATQVVVKNYEELIVSTREETFSANERMEQYEESLAVAREESKTSQAKLVEYAERISSIEAEGRRVEHRLEELNKKLHEAAVAKEESEKRANSAEAQIKTLLEEKSQQEGQQQGLVLRYQAAEAHVRSLEEQVKHIENYPDLSNVKVLVDRALAAEEQVKSLKTQLAIDDAAYTQQLQNSTLVNSAISSNVKELENRAVAAEELVRSLQTKLAHDEATYVQQLQNAARQSEEKYTAQIKALQQRLSTVSEEKGDLLNELVQDDVSLEELVRINRDNKKEIDRLQGIITQHETTQRMQDQKIQNEQAAKHNISQQLESARIQLHLKDDELRRVQSLKSSTESSALKQKDIKLAELESRLGVLQNQNISLQNDLATRLSINGDPLPLVHRSYWGYKILIPATVLVAGVGAALRLKLLKFLP